MENKIEKIKNKIELLIAVANDKFKIYGWEHSQALMLAKINGMLDVLSILTDKTYYYDENGLHER